MKTKAFKYFLIYLFFLIVAIVSPTAFIGDMIARASAQIAATTLIAAWAYLHLTKYQATDSQNTPSTGVIDDIKRYEGLRNATFNSGTLMIESTPGTSLEKIIEDAITLVPGADAGTLTVIDEEGKMRFIAGKKFDIDILNSIGMDFTDSFLYKESKGYVSLPMVIENIRDYDQDVFSEEANRRIAASSNLEIKSTLSTPIYKGNAIVGTINLDSTKHDAFTEIDKRSMMYFSSMLGLSLRFKDILSERTRLLRNDQLTGAYSRPYFEEIFVEYQDEAYKKNKPFSLIVMDLNYMKFINDSFGRLYGDTVLSSFAETVRTLISTNDMFVRFGGNEFILILNNSQKEDALAKVSQISKAVESIEIEYMSRRIPVQFSYGISHCPEESMILDILIKIADNRMYKHKELQKSENKANKDFEVFFSTTRDMIAGIEEADLNNKL